MDARTSKNRYENCSMDFDIRCPIVIERTKSHSTNQRFISTSTHIWLFNSREGSYARLMKVNFDRLIDGVVEAAKTSFDGIGSTAPDVAIFISCVGRKPILKQRIEEEAEGVRDVFGEQTISTGFYSYGETAPFIRGTNCELHNQSMTITTLLEE